MVVCSGRRFRQSCSVRNEGLENFQTQIHRISLSRHGIVSSFTLRLFTSCRRRILLLHLSFSARPPVWRVQEHLKRSEIRNNGEFEVLQMRPNSENERFTRHFLFEDFVDCPCLNTCECVRSGWTTVNYDDPDTPGPGYWEINLPQSRRNRRWGAQRAVAEHINYGVGERIQLKFEIPWLSGAKPETEAVGYRKFRVWCEVAFPRSARSGLSHGPLILNWNSTPAAPWPGKDLLKKGRFLYRQKLHCG